MKKTLLALAAIAGISMLFMGCPHSTKTPASPVSDPGSGEDVTITVPDDSLILWESEEAKGTKFTSEGWGPYLNFDEENTGKDLTGYKYLNVVAYVPSISGYQFVVQPMSNEENGEHPQGSIIIKTASSTAQTYQTLFGTNYGKYTDWSTGSGVEKEISDNIIENVQLYAQDLSTWGTTDGKEIYILKVYATNTAL